VILSGFGQKIPGARDKAGCGLLFCRLGKMMPDEFKNFDLEVTNWVIWNNAEGNMWEDMDFHRNGLTFVFDLTDIGWKNVDLGLQRRINATLMDNFPMRVTKVLVINPPALFKTLLAAARLIFKKQVMDRLQILESLDQVKLHVDENVLPEEFGGKNTYGMPQFITFVEKARILHPIDPPPTQQNGMATSKKVKKTTSVPHIVTPPKADDKNPSPREQYAAKKPSTSLGDVSTHQTAAKNEKKGEKKTSPHAFL